MGGGRGRDRVVEGWKVLLYSRMKLQWVISLEGTTRPVEWFVDKHRRAHNNAVGTEAQAPAAFVCNPVQSSIPFREQPGEPTWGPCVGVLPAACWAKLLGAGGGQVMLPCYPRRMM